MRGSTATAEAFDPNVVRLPLAVRKRISNIVSLGGTVHGVEEIDPDTFIIKRTVPGYREEIVKA
jgi:hypothetical protein